MYNDKKSNQFIITTKKIFCGMVVLAILAMIGALIIHVIDGGTPISFFIDEPFWGIYLFALLCTFIALACSLAQKRRKAK